MNKLFLLSFLLLACLSCNNKPTEQKKSGFVIDIPDTSKTHIPNFSYEIKNKAVEELNLNKLEKGVDSFELRLWANISATNYGRVVVIKKMDNQWICFDYQFLYNSGEFKNAINKLTQLTDFTIDTFWVKKKYPKSGWDTFLKEIENQKIYELPDQNEISGWENIVADGFTFYIEFATQNKYRYYSYNCPDVYEDNFIENKLMSNILEIFRKEFNLSLVGNNGFRCRQKK